MQHLNNRNPNQYKMSLNNMSQDSADFALLASFLANKQSEKQNQTLRLIHDIVQGTETDKSKLKSHIKLVYIRK